MILTRLYELYDRLADDPECADQLPEFGESVELISFAILLDEHGNLLDVLDMRERVETASKKKNSKPKIEIKARKMIVPKFGERTSGIKPNFLWDNAAYMMGYADEGKDDTRVKSKMFPAFRDYNIQTLKDVAEHNVEASAVIEFLKKWNPDAISGDTRKKLEEFGTNFGVFRVAGKSTLVHENVRLKELYKSQGNVKDKTSVSGICLITGKRTNELVDVVGTKVKLSDCNQSNGIIVSFNTPAYTSYGKEQTYNAPMSEVAAFKSHTALNYLLSTSGQRLKIADTTVLFWTEKKTETENLFADILQGSTPETDSSQDTAYLQKLQEFWKILRSAGNPDLSGVGDDASTRFYAVGIAGNVTRVVVRFWYENTLGDFIERLRRHHNDMAIDKQFDSQDDVIPIWKILDQTARDKKGIPPLLGHELLRAIIGGLPYPASIYQLVLNRINVACGGKDKKYSVGTKVSYEKAAIIKAFLIRNKKKGELTMSLNVENSNPAYLLGRLFATLEKTQDEASGGVNAGIGDKYYSSASATPRIVFPTLLDLFRKHLHKLGNEKGGLAVVREKLVGEILDKIDSVEGFPANLSLEDRGVFALGYYQQMRVFFTKKESEKESAESES